MTDYRRAKYPDGRYVWQPGMSQAEAEKIIRGLERQSDASRPWWKRFFK